MNADLIFAGEGHGGIVALISLQDEFPSIDIVSNDPNIIKLMRKSDRQVQSIDSTDSTDLVVCAGYHTIVTKDILKKKTIINTHPSLLPKYRGMHGLVWGMLNFEKKLGFTIHLMNEYIDDGDILDQYSMNYDGETSFEIMEKFDKYVEETLGTVVKKYVNGLISLKKQDKSQATWVAKRNLEDCIIDFNWDEPFIRMFFKALVRPYPLPMLKINNKLYEIDGYEFQTVNYYTHIGRVVNIENEHVYIKTKDGLLIINNLIEFETKSKLKAIELMKIGKRL